MARPKALTAAQIAEVQLRLPQPGNVINTIARDLRVSRWTLDRVIAEHEMTRNNQSIARVYTEAELDRIATSMMPRGRRYRVLQHRVFEKPEVAKPPDT